MKNIFLILIILTILLPLGNRLFEGKWLVLAHSKEATELTQKTLPIFELIDNIGKKWDEKKWGYVNKHCKYAQKIENFVFGTEHTWRTYPIGDDVDGLDVVTYQSEKNGAMCLDEIEILKKSHFFKQVLFHLECKIPKWEEVTKSEPHLFWRTVFAGQSQSFETKNSYSYVLKKRPLNLRFKFEGTELKSVIISAQPSEIAEETKALPPVSESASALDLSDLRIGHRWRIAKNIRYDELPVSVRKKQSRESFEKHITDLKLKQKQEFLPMEKIGAKLVSQSTLDNLQITFALTRRTYSALDGLLSVKTHYGENVFSHIETIEGVLIDFGNIKRKIILPMNIDIPKMYPGAKFSEKLYEHIRYDKKQRIVVCRQFVFLYENDVLTKVYYSDGKTGPQNHGFEVVGKFVLN